MILPLQITTRNMARSEALEARVREKAEKLDRFSRHIMGFHVVIEAPHRHHREGKRYAVRIDVTVPGTELIVSRQSDEDVEVALRDAFDSARRQLEDYERRRRRDVKVHEPPPRARVARLFDEDGYGFLETPDGREVYFHRNSVLHGAWGALKVGDEVRFFEEDGEKGPQASTVELALPPAGRRRSRPPRPEERAEPG
jgi:ribosomal subunit interface protein